MLDEMLDEMLNGKAVPKEGKNVGWLFWTLVILPIPLGILCAAKSMSDFDNYAIVLVPFIWAGCWFGAFCLWVGSRFF